MVSHNAKVHNGRELAGRALKLFICLGALSVALRACALQGETPRNDAFQTPLTSLVSPLFLEKSTNPHALTPEAGWQVGGVNTNFAGGRNGNAFNLRGGLFYSQGQAPRSLLDASVPLPDPAQGDAPGANAGALPRLFRFNGAAKGAGPSDRITYQRLDYAGAGLRLSGSYADVGADFQGLDALSQQMRASDPTGANLLKLGMRQTDFSASYTGIQRLNLSAGATVTENTQQGHKEFGLTRSTTTHGAGLALGQRHRLEYAVSNLTEEWDAAVVARDLRQVHTETLKLSGEFGQKSKFSLGQTEASTLVGQQQTDSRQHDLTLAVNEWTRFAFSGNYATKLTEQTGVKDDLLKLNTRLALSSTMQLTGVLEDRTSWNPQTATGTERNFRDLKLETKLSPAISLVNQYSLDGRNANRGETTTLAHKLAWDVAPNWKVQAELVDAENEKYGESSRFEYQLAHTFANTEKPAEITFFSRNETLSAQAVQQRREVAYTRALAAGKTPPTLVVRAGQYALTGTDAAAEEAMVTAQLLNLQAGSRTALSLGYYDGPTLGANHLRYRAWGLRPKGNAGAWTAQDFMPYREWGGELTHQLTDATKVVLKHYAGTFGDGGERSTLEYGVEQRLGKFTLLAGRRVTEQPGTDGQTEQTESWWRLHAPSATPLPDWAVNAARTSVFQDGAAWGFSQAPAWVEKPVAGFTVERQLTLVGQKRVDDYTCRYARMLDDDLFLQASYSRNPRVAGRPHQVDAVQRHMAQVTYRAKPNLHLFSRLVEEERLDVENEQQTLTVGMNGRLSTTERLQVQVDLLSRTTADGSSSGNAYAVQYERIMGADQSLVLKARLTPEDFCTPEERVKLEAQYTRAF